MYSGPIRIAERQGFTLDSYGNGAAYCFARVDVTPRESVFIQGEDAERFRAELEACEAGEAEGGHIAEAGALVWLWDAMAWGEAATADT